MKKSLFLLMLLSNAFVLFAIDHLPFYKETDCFAIFCESTDHALIDEMEKEGECFLKQLENDFRYQYSGPKIIMKMYPDLDSLHVAIGHPDAPDWLIARADLDVILIVSPNNPGPYHTFDTARGILKRALTGFIMHNKYGERYKKLIPRWLMQGVVLYENNYYSPDQYKNIIKEISSFPSLEQLEAIDRGDSYAFEKLHGIVVSFSLVHFIEKKWGWDIVLDLLDDYTKFESILHVTKQGFVKEWQQFLVSEIF